MGNFLYVRPDESFMDGTVSGTVDETYDANWLLTPSPGYPVRGAGGLSLTATAPAARTVGLIAVCHHNIAGTTSVGGYTIPAATLGADGIYLNTYLSITPASLSSLAVTASGTPAIIGSLYAGVRRELGGAGNLRSEPDFGFGEPFEWGGEFSSLPPYDPGLDARTLSGEIVMNDTEVAALIAWWQSTRKGTRPSLIVPDSAVNDAWLVTFTLTTKPYKANLHKVSLAFVEIPRTRW